MDIYILYSFREKRIYWYIFISFFEYSRINDYICDIGRWLKKRFFFLNVSLVMVFCRNCFSLLSFVKKNILNIKLVNSKI